MPGRAPCEPHARKPDGSVGRAPDEQRERIAILEREGDSGREGENSRIGLGPATNRNGILGLGVITSSLAARPSGRCTFRYWRSTVLPVYPFNVIALAASLACCSAGVTKIFSGLIINPNSVPLPSDTRSHGFRRSSSLSSGRPFPTSTGTDWSPPGTADPGRSAARGDWPRSAGIP